MKKMIIALCLLSLLLLSSCDELESKIGGADGPTAIIVSEK